MQTFLRVSILWCAMVCGFFLQAGETRTWTDSSGKFKVEAELLRIEGDKIVIKKSDGKVLTMPLDKLSEADQAFIKENQENPFAGGEEENPFAGGNDEEQSDSRSTRQRTSERRSGRPFGFPSSRMGAGDAPINLPGTPGGNLFDKAGKALDLHSAYEGGGDADKTWSCEADPAPLPELKEKPRSMFFRFGDTPFGVFSREVGFFPYALNDDLKVLYALTVTSHGNRDGKTLLILGDLQSGKSESLQFDQKLTPFGVSPDGRKALFGRSEWGGSDWGKRKDLHIVGIEGSKLVPITVYEPFAEASRPNEVHNLEGDVQWAGWIDNDHIMVQSGKRHVIVLNVASGKVLWKMSISFVSAVAFSPGRKYCLISDSAGTLLLESLTGKSVGRLDGTSGRASMWRFDFSPDGKTIASYGPDGVMLWDATNGEAREPFYIGNLKQTSVLWVDNRFVMVGSHLVDVETHFPAWSYHPFSDAMRFFGGYCWYTAGFGRDGKRLVAVKLPHSKAVESSRESDSSWLPVSPGVEVSLELDDSVKKDREQIQEKMEEKLKANELLLVEDADISLVLKVTREKEQTVTYGIGRRYMPSFGKGGTEIKYRPSRFSIEYRQGEKTLWSISKTTSAPDSIELDEVQKSSLQEVVDKAMKKSNAGYKDWFLKADIPKRIPCFDEKKQSMLTDSGIRDK